MIVVLSVVGRKCKQEMYSSYIILSKVRLEREESSEEENQNYVFMPQLPGLASLSDDQILEGLCTFSAYKP